METPRKKKRVTAVESDTEEQSAGCSIAQVVHIAHNETRTQMKLVVESKVNEVKSGVEGLKKDLQESREAEQYVTGKHADQASMLRKLNKDLRDQIEENKKLRNENTELREELGRKKAYEDCIYMNGEILDEIKSLKKLLRTPRT